MPGFFLSIALIFEHCAELEHVSGVTDLVPLVA